MFSLQWVHACYELRFWPQRQVSIHSWSRIAWAHLGPDLVQKSIDVRLDAVQEIVQSEDVYSAIKTALKTMDKVDIDKLIAAVSNKLFDRRRTSLIHNIVDHYSSSRESNLESPRCVASCHHPPSASKRGSLYPCASACSRQHQQPNATDD